MPKKQSWYKDALCATDSVIRQFFESNRKRDIQVAQLACRSCPVRMDCLEHAISNKETEGIWGGLCYIERLEIEQAWLQLTPLDDFVRNYDETHRSRAS